MYISGEPKVCPFCISVQVCSNNSEVYITLKPLFNTSVLTANVCGSNASNETIPLNTAKRLEVQSRTDLYSIDCEICAGTHTIELYINGSEFFYANACSTDGTYSIKLILCTCIYSTVQSTCVRMYLNAGILDICILLLTNK